MWGWIVAGVLFVIVVGLVFCLWQILGAIDTVFKRMF